MCESQKADVEGTLLNRLSLAIPKASQFCISMGLVEKLSLGAFFFGSCCNFSFSIQHLSGLCRNCCGRELPASQGRAVFALELP